MLLLSSLNCDDWEVESELIAFIMSEVEGDFWDCERVFKATEEGVRDIIWCKSIEKRNT